MGIKGTLAFQGDLNSGSLGTFTKDTPFNSKFSLTLPKEDFGDVYAILRSKRPIYILYNAEKTFEDAGEDETVDIKGCRIQTESEEIGEGIDQS